MIKFLNDEAIVINKHDTGEADRYIQVFTKNFGRVSFLIRGVRKTKKRELLAVDILSFSKFTFYKKNDGYVVSTFQGIDSYFELKTELSNLQFALYIISILNAILVEGERERQLYDIVIRTLNYLKNSKSFYNNLVLIASFLYFIIKNEGYHIEIKNGNIFSYEKSTFEENIEGKNTAELSKKVKGIVVKIIKNNVKTMLNEETMKHEMVAVVRFFENYLNFHLETKLNFGNFIMEEWNNG